MLIHHGTVNMHHHLIISGYHLGKLTYFGNGKDLLLAEVLPPHEVGVWHAGVVHLTHDGKEAGLFAALDDGGVGPEDSCSPNTKMVLGFTRFHLYF